MSVVQSEQTKTASSPASSPMRWSILAACCLASAAYNLAPPLWVFDPPEVQPFDAAWSDYRLIASLAGVLLIIFLLFGGVAGDLYGRRRFWLIGLTGFAVANMLILVSPDPTWHVAFRGCGLALGAIYLPLVLATINYAFAGRSRTIALACYTVVNAVSVQIAWLQGEFLVGWFGWRAAYVLPLVMALLALWWVYRYIPETWVGWQVRPETLIFSGWTLLILAVIYGVMVLPVASDFWWWVVGAALLAALTGGLLVLWWNLKRPKELLQQHSFRSRDLTALIITGAVIQFLLHGFGLRTLGYFQVVRSMPAIVAVVALAPLLFGLLVAVYLFLRAVHPYRARSVIAAGLVVMAVALAATALLPITAPYLLFALPLVVFGVGYLVASTVWTSAFLHIAVARSYGVNAAISSATSAIGGAVGSAVTGNLLARLGLEFYLQRLTAANVNVADALEALIHFKTLVLSDPADIAAVTEYLRFDLLTGYREVYALAYSQILWLMVAFCLVTTAIIGFGLRRSLKATTRPPVEEELGTI